MPAIFAMVVGKQHLDSLSVDYLLSTIYQVEIGIVVWV